ncbi:hypothetical protein FPV67DRAFT_1447125 [Lyophyllum atratum]|nr:hypothetical protein FPV67DRAFT_1447125 [Lyophyllum atratum]
MSMPFPSSTYQLELPFSQVHSCPSHAALLKAAAKISFGPMIHPQPTPVDIFDNPFVPSDPIPYLPHDFCELDPAGNHIGGCIGPNPSIWRVLNDEKFTFVFPRDLSQSLAVPTSSKPKLAGTFRLSFRPTLDEFMSGWENSRDSDDTDADSYDDIDGDDEYCVTVAKRKAKNQPNRPTKKVFLVERDGAAPKHKHRGGAVNKEVIAAPREALHEAANKQTQRLYRCTATRDCNQVCFTKGDLYRHLQSKIHQRPSIPCTKRCGAMFSRADAAKRHEKRNSCGWKNNKSIAMA